MYHIQHLIIGDSTDIQVPKWVGPFIEHYEKSKKYDSIRKLILESKEVL